MESAGKRVECGNQDEKFAVKIQCMNVRRGKTTRGSWVATCTGCRKCTYQLYLQSPEDKVLCPSSSSFSFSSVLSSFCCFFLPLLLIILWSGVLSLIMNAADVLPHAALKVSIDARKEEKKRGMIIFWLCNSGRDQDERASEMREGGKRNCCLQILAFWSPILTSCDEIRVCSCDPAKGKIPFACPTTRPSVCVWSISGNRCCCRWRKAV